MKLTATFPVAAAQGLESHRERNRRNVHVRFRSEVLDRELERRIIATYQRAGPVPSVTPATCAVQACWETTSTAPLPGRVPSGIPWQEVELVRARVQGPWTCPFKHAGSATNLRLPVPHLAWMAAPGAAFLSPWTSLCSAGRDRARACASEPHGQEVAVIGAGPAGLSVRCSSG